MRVSDFKKRKRRVTEHSFEDAFAEVCLEKGVYTRHMSDKLAGLPDRYIGGGKWCELKSLEYARGGVPFRAGMTVEQVRVCHELSEAEEEVWYLALIHTGEVQWVIFVPYHVIDGRDGQFKMGGDWTHHYKGKETLRSLLPRDWYV